MSIVFFNKKWHKKDILGTGLSNTFGKMKTSAFSTNTQSRFASVVVDGVLGPLRGGTPDSVFVSL